MDLLNDRFRELENPDRENFRHVVFGENMEWDFKNSEGVRIPGRVYLPPGFDESKKYPLIVYYYGGTNPVARSFGGRYPFNIYAAHGYVVYVLQPSGATGFGQEFAAMHVNNWGITVTGEIIEGTRQFLDDHPFIDTERVGCMGASYGGFMTTLLHGSDDTNVPVGESIQLYVALKLLGRPVELVKVKGEDHHILTYSKRIAWSNTKLAWFDRWLKDQPQWWEEMYPEKNF